MASGVYELTIKVTRARPPAALRTRPTRTTTRPATPRTTRRPLRKHLIKNQQQTKDR